MVICSWRDETHPEAGGSERYVGRVARYLATRGDDVLVLTSDHGGAPRDEVDEGVRYRRRGGRLSVFARATAYLALARPDVVLDVQNGIPFGARLTARAPVVVLVHHVHREQWPVALGPLAARIGWFVESVVAPRLLRGCRYVTVSHDTAAELAGLGVRSEDVTVVHNGRDDPLGQWPRDPRPTLCVVGRLVPHKQVEHAVEAVRRLSNELDVQLHVVGDGLWADELRAYVRASDVGDRVHLHGYLDEWDKHRLMSTSWVHLCPSLKEGWGLVVVEAGSHGVPTVAYRDAGGVTESVLDGVTGLLADDLDDLVTKVRTLLDDDGLRERTGAAARVYSEGFRWDETGRLVSDELDRAMGLAVRSGVALGRRDPRGGPGEGSADAVDHERLCHGVGRHRAGLDDPEDRRGTEDGAGEDGDDDCDGGLHDAPRVAAGPGRPVDRGSSAVGPTTVTRE